MIQDILKNKIASLGKIYTPQDKNSTAQCRNSRFSDSMFGGVCSSNGGVKEWLIKRDYAARKKTEKTPVAPVLSTPSVVAPVAPTLNIVSQSEIPQNNYGTLFNQKVIRPAFLLKKKYSDAIIFVSVLNNNNKETTYVLDKDALFMSEKYNLPILKNGDLSLTLIDNKEKDFYLKSLLQNGIKVVLIEEKDITDAPVLSTPPSVVAPVAPIGKYKNLDIFSEMPYGYKVNKLYTPPIYGTLFINNEKGEKALLKIKDNPFSEKVAPIQVDAPVLSTPPSVVAPVLEDIPLVDRNDQQGFFLNVAEPSCTKVLFKKFGEHYYTAGKSDKNTLTVNHFFNEVAATRAKETIKRVCNVDTEIVNYPENNSYKNYFALRVVQQQNAILTPQILNNNRFLIEKPIRFNLDFIPKPKRGNRYSEEEFGKVNNAILIDNDPNKREAVTKLLALQKYLDFEAFPKKTDNYHFKIGKYVIKSFLQDLVIRYPFNTNYGNMFYNRKETPKEQRIDLREKSQRTYDNVIEAYLVTIDYFFENAIRVASGYYELSKAKTPQQFIDIYVSLKEKPFPENVILDFLYQYFNADIRFSFKNEYLIKDIAQGKISLSDAQEIEKQTQQKYDNEIAAKDLQLQNETVIPAVKILYQYLIVEGKNLSMQGISKRMRIDRTSNGSYEIHNKAVGYRVIGNNLEALIEELSLRVIDRKKYYYARPKGENWRERLIEAGAVLGLNTPPSVVAPKNDDIEVMLKSYPFSKKVAPVAVELDNDVYLDLENMLKSYGWTMQKNGNTIALFSRKNTTPAVNIEMKGSKYVMKDRTGMKLMSGNGQLVKGVENLLKQYYYATKLDPPSVSGVRHSFFI